MTKSELFDYNKHTLHNREEIEASGKCGCAACCEIFDAREVVDYADEGTTAVCPYCSTDAVIGDRCGENLTPDFLKRLNRQWF